MTTTFGLEAHTWTLGNQLPDGEGGFGRVFDVTREDGLAGVVKFVDQDPGAERELLMGDSIAASSARNVIPVWDTGAHDGQWAIVMPKAEKSLASHMTAGPISSSEALATLEDVAIALCDLASANPAIIHRDLKPGNVLLFDGAWCLADFGIARYAEHTTAADTRKWSLTRPYAAPEQWRFERATPATDVYAFGVMAYELLAGKRPFLGPDFRQQHLTEPAPSLFAGTPRMKTLVEECLYKAAPARPSAQNILARLKKASIEPRLPGASKLAEVNSIESGRLALDYAEAVRQAEDEATDAALFEVAEKSFNSFYHPLVETVQGDAPLSRILYGAGGGVMLFVAELRAGQLGLGKPRQVSGWDGPFRVIAESVITVTQDKASAGYAGRSHSLWYCDAHEEGRFAWHEMAFMNLGYGSEGTRPVVPFRRDAQFAAEVFANVTGTVQLAWPVEELDRADPTEFIDRWIGWFADAASGNLQQPGSMPEKPTEGSYRTN